MLEIRNLSVAYGYGYGYTRARRCAGRGAELTGIPGSPPDLSKLGGGCPFRDRCAFAFDACSKVKP